MVRIDERLEGIENKLDTKCDKTDHERLEDRVTVISDKTNHLDVKIAGVSGVIAATGIWLKSQFFS